MSSDEIRHGWTNFGGASRKFHFVPEDDPKALCGKWGLSPFIADARGKADWSPETGEGPDDCKACRRKLDAQGGSK